MAAAEATPPMHEQLERYRRTAATGRSCLLAGSNVSKAGGEIFPGRLRTAGVAPQGDDAVTGLKELCAHGDEALEVLDKATEEVAEHVVESDIDTAVREAFDDFPPDIRRQHLPDDVRVTPRFVEPTDDSDLSRIGHESL